MVNTVGILCKLAINLRFEHDKMFDVDVVQNITDMTASVTQGISKLDMDDVGSRLGTATVFELGKAAGSADITPDIAWLNTVIEILTKYWRSLSSSTKKEDEVSESKAETIKVIEDVIKQFDKLDAGCISAASEGVNVINHIINVVDNYDDGAIKRYAACVDAQRLHRANSITPPLIFSQAYAKFKESVKADHPFYLDLDNAAMYIVRDTLKEALVQYTCSNID